MSDESELLEFRQRHSARVRESVEELLTMHELLDAQETLREDFIEVVGWEAITLHIRTLRFTEVSAMGEAPQMLDEWRASLMGEIGPRMRWWFYLWSKVSTPRRVRGWQRYTVEELPDGRERVRLELEFQPTRSGAAPTKVLMASWGIALAKMLLDSKECQAVANFSTGYFHGG